MMLEMMLSDAASEAKAGSKLVSAIEKTTRRVLPFPPACAGAALAAQATPESARAMTPIRHARRWASDEGCGSFMACEAHVTVLREGPEASVKGKRGRTLAIMPSRFGSETGTWK